MFLQFNWLRCRSPGLMHWTAHNFLTLLFSLMHPPASSNILSIPVFNADPELQIEFVLSSFKKLEESHIWRVNYMPEREFNVPSCSALLTKEFILIWFQHILQFILCKKWFDKIKWFDKMTNSGLKCLKLGTGQDMECELEALEINPHGCTSPLYMILWYCMALCGIV